MLLFEKTQSKVFCRKIYESALTMREVLFIKCIFYIFKILGLSTIKINTVIKKRLQFFLLTRKKI